MAFITKADLVTHVYPELIDVIFRALEWLGLDWDGTPVHQSERGELYTAARGEGAYLVHRDGTTEKLRCNTGVPLERALVATGFGYSAQRRAHQAEVLLGVLPRVRDIRRGGSAAVDLCSVASGRVDGYFERGPQEWDIAAGGLIVQEGAPTIASFTGTLRKSSPPASHP